MSTQVMGDRIRLLRQQAGMTQAQLAEALGVSKNAVTVWETGKSFPSMQQVAPLCSILSTCADYLFGLQDAPNASPILQLYQQLTIYDQRNVSALIRSMLQSYEDARADQGISAGS